MDSSFGKAGVAVLASSASAIALLSTGKLLIMSAFNSLVPSSTSSGAIMRYNYGSWTEGEFEASGLHKETIFGQPPTHSILPI